MTNVPHAGQGAPPAAMPTTLPAATLPPAAAPAQAPMPSAAAPPYSLNQGKHGAEMRVGTWTIRSSKRAILNGKEIDAVEKELGLPLPEMTFGNNGLHLAFDGGVSIVFDGISALREVAVGDGWEERVGGGVLVSMAESWSKRSATSALSDVPLSAKPVRPHDWTFSTTYSGTVTGSSFEPSESAQIPMKLLARQDPVLDRILFYEDVGLFEDELHDNGESILNVRLRVMPHSLFLLSRLFVRVDHVLFRIFDVRMYHAFDSGEVVRECTGLEAEYDEVKAYLEKPTELTPLTDPNWVYGVLQKIAAKRDGTSGASAAGRTTPGPAAGVPAAGTASPSPASTHGHATQAPWASSQPSLAPRATTQAPWAQTTAAPWATAAPTTTPTPPRDTSAPVPRPSLPHSQSGSNKKPWPGLGRRLHVLRLPGDGAGIAGAQAGLRNLNLEP